MKTRKAPLIPMLLALLVLACNGGGSPPQEWSTLEAVLEHSPSAEASLGALFTLACEESVAEVYLGGEPMLGRL